jgi:hypothetical protein
MPIPENADGFGKDSEVARHLSIHPKTLPRWDRKPELGFPKPVYFNGRKYRRWADIHEWTRRAAAAFASDNAA